jgi:MFS transporter, ACS family, hexuronate transporter
LFAATAISYLDRQTLAVVAPVLRDEMGLSNFAYARMVFSFLLAYTLFQPITGWLIDRIGSRRGFALIMAWWSIAAMLHAAGRGMLSFSVLRFLLGAGEAGSWSACVRSTAQWLPSEQRGLATGIWSAGTSAGLVVSVPLVAWITVRFGWPSAFVVVGLTGLVWIGAWLYVYPASSDEGLARERPAAGELSELRDRQSIGFGTLLRSPQVLALLVARMFADPVAWFYNAWVPEYLHRTAAFSMTQIGQFGWIPFVGQGVAIVLGGAISDRLCAGGRPVVEARIRVMRAGVALMTVGALAAAPMPVAAAMAAITIAVFGFGLWASNMMSLCADAFDRRTVGAVTGLSGIGAGIGGMIYTLVVGWTVDRVGYPPVFVMSGALPLVALAVVHRGILPARQQRP